LTSLVFLYIRGVYVISRIATTESIVEFVQLKEIGVFPILEITLHPSAQVSLKLNVCWNLRQVGNAI